MGLQSFFRLSCHKYDVIGKFCSQIRIFQPRCLSLQSYLSTIEGNYKSQEIFKECLILRKGIFSVDFVSGYNYLIQNSHLIQTLWSTFSSKNFLLIYRSDEHREIIPRLVPSPLPPSKNGGNMREKRKNRRLREKLFWRGGGEGRRV